MSDDRYFFGSWHDFFYSSSHRKANFFPQSKNKILAKHGLPKNDLASKLAGYLERLENKFVPGFWFSKADKRDAANYVLYLLATPTQRREKSLHCPYLSDTVFEAMLEGELGGIIKAHIQELDNKNLSLYTRLMVEYPVKTEQENEFCQAVKFLV